ncbi:integrating conjugative element protein [Serratia marcescens]
MKRVNCLLLGLSLMSTAALANLNVIADLGGEDASPYFEGINRQEGAQSSPAVPSAPASSADAEAAMLPVATPELTPGDVTDRPLQLPGIGALFLVGEDEVSRAWLQANADALRTKHAAGLVVNISDRAALQALRELAPGVPMAPASGSELARRLQLTHYPVLITDTGLTQRVMP